MWGSPRGEAASSENFRHPCSSCREARSRRSRGAPSTLAQDFTSVVGSTCPSPDPGAAASKSRERTGRWSTRSTTQTSTPSNALPSDTSSPDRSSSSSDAKAAEVLRADTCSAEEGCSRFVSKRRAGRAAFARCRGLALRRANTADRAERESGGDAECRHKCEEVARNGRPLAASCDGCGGTQPAEFGVLLVGRLTAGLRAPSFEIPPICCTIAAGMASCKPVHCPSGAQSE